MKDGKYYKSLFTKYLPRDTSTIFLAAMLGVLVSVYNELFFLIKIGLKLDDETISVIKLIVLNTALIGVSVIYIISINSKEK